MGRHTFDVVDAPDGWDETRGYGADRQPSTPPPIFVVTHEAPTSVRLVEMFTFVTTGLPDAVAQARAASGDKDVYLMGGGELGGAGLASGLVDRVSLHVAPQVLGAGTPLFAGVPRPFLRIDEAATVVTPNAVHLAYDVVRP